MLKSNWGELKWPYISDVNWDICLWCMSLFQNNYCYLSRHSASVVPRPHTITRKVVWWWLNIVLVLLSQQCCFRASQSDCKYSCLHPSNIGYTCGMHSIWITWCNRKNGHIMVHIPKKAFKCHQTFLLAWGFGSGNETSIAHTHIVHAQVLSDHTLCTGIGLMSITLFSFCVCQQKPPEGFELQKNTVKLTDCVVQKLTFTGKFEIKLTDQMKIQLSPV